MYATDSDQLDETKIEFIVSSKSNHRMNEIITNRHTVDRWLKTRWDSIKTCDKKPSPSTVFFSSQVLS